MRGNEIMQTDFNNLVQRDDNSPSIYLSSAPSYDNKLRHGNTSLGIDRSKDLQRQFSIHTWPTTIINTSQNVTQSIRPLSRQSCRLNPVRRSLVVRYAETAATGSQLYIYAASASYILVKEDSDARRRKNIRHHPCS